MTTQHLERVNVETSVCSCTKLRNNWFVTAFLKGAVIVIYRLR